MVFDLDAAMRGEVPLHWDDTYGARIGILPRFGTDADVRWFDVDPCYVFHPMNAYVDGDDGRVRRRPPRVDVAGLDGGLPAVASCTAGRSTSAPGAVSEEQLDDDVPHAFPRVDDRVVGLRHRYGWAVAPRGGGDGT